MVYLSDEEDRNEFAKRAAQDFAKFPDHSTFGDVKPGSYLALRWGMGEDCVLVLKLDENFEPINYQQLVNGYKKFKIS
jgi:hypothetical protein